jgi:anti-sigma B factor antagonist
MSHSGDTHSWSDPGFELVQEPMSPRGIVLAVRGELDAAAVPQLRERLDAAIEDRQTPIVVDLSEVSFIDSLSLATVVRAQTRLGGRSRMALVAQHPYVLLIMEAGGLDSVLAVFESRDQAEGYVRQAGEPPPPPG